VRRPAIVWAIATAGAVALAIPGVILYAEEPGVMTYQLNGLLLLPLGGITLYGLHRVLPLRVQWGAAVLIAPLGGVAYLIWPNDQWWNYGALTPVPLIALAVLRQERIREERGDDEEPFAGGWADGPWGPP
jgi:peptidoglycan/LPS O-acetylase OafA/YrhL